MHLALRARSASDAAQFVSPLLVVYQDTAVCIRLAGYTGTACVLYERIKSLVETVDNKSNNAVIDRRLRPHCCHLEELL